MFLLGKKGGVVPAGSQAVSHHHIPGWQGATQRAKLGIVAAAPRRIADARALCLTVGLALMSNTGLLGAGVAADPGLEANSSGDIQVSASAHPLHLGFACELATEPLEKLFADPAVVPDLQALHAEVSLALGDLSPGRASVVRRLNEADIPVTAWMALPAAQGYYVNAGNAPQAAARFAELEKWTAENGLRWAAIGLDIEPNIQEFAALRNRRLRLAATLAERYFEFERIRKARREYAALIRQMQFRGYRVETYQFPFIIDEREARTTLLERLFGLVDVRGDREVLMLYTSFNHAMDSALVWKYGPEAQAIVVGSTKSDPATDARFPPLSWDELSRDLRVASHFSHTVGVYSLEGCVHQGFLPRLASMTWNQPVTIPAEAVRKVNLLRARIHTVLWIGSNLPYLVLAVFFAIGWWLGRRRMRRRSAAGGGG